MQCQSLIEELLASHSTDLQQRAYELQALLALDARAVESILPLDASCEDIEVTFSLHAFPCNANFLNLTVILFFLNLG